MASQSKDLREVVATTEAIISDLTSENVVVVVAVVVAVVVVVEAVVKDIQDTNGRPENQVMITMIQHRMKR